MRSAEPPTSSGTRAVRISSACCEDLRVATGVATAAAAVDQRRPGRVPVPRQLVRHPAPELRRVRRVGGGVLGEQRVPRGLPLRALARARPTPRVTAAGISNGAAVHCSALARRARPRRRPAARRAPRRCRPCSASRSRCACGRGSASGAPTALRAACERRVERRRVVAVDAGDHVPAVGAEARRACRRGTSPRLRRRSRCRCRRRARRACRGRATPASDAASCETPSIRQPSPTNT